MNVPIGVVGLGVVSGAGLALQAAGLVLVFRSNRFLNLAQVQIGAVAGTLFALLVNTRPLLRGVSTVCPPCLEQVSPTVLQVNYWGSLILSLLVGMGVSWLVYVGVVRRLDRAPRLVLTVAALFLITLLTGVQRLLVNLLATSDQREFGGVTNAIPPPVSFQATVGPVRFVLADLLTVGVAVVALGGIALLLARTRLGTGIRASAENTPRAQTLGVDVVSVTGRVWLLVGALSGAASVLATMSAPAGDGTSATGVTTLVRVLVVVVLARFTSLVVAGLGALLLGVVTQVVQFSAGSTTVLDASMVLVVSGLLLVQRRRSTRSDADTSSAYFSGRQARAVSSRRWSAPTVSVALVLLPFLLSPRQTTLLTTAAIYAIVGLSLLVLTGWAGQVSLGQFGFAAVGAWVTAASGLPFLLALPVSALAGAAVALLVGLPALRLQGLTLAVSTLAFAASVPAVLLNPDLLGSVLPDSVARPSLLGVHLDNGRVFYAVVIGVLALAAVGVAGLRASRTARVLIAARDNEAAAQAFGISLLRARLSAFAVSGFLAALAGSLFAYQQGNVAADGFTVQQSLLVFTYTVIGGLGSLAGPLVGFAALAALTLSTSSPGILATVNGLGGLALLMLAPGGLAQVGYDVRDGLLRRLDRRTGNDRVAPITPGSSRPVSKRYALDGQWAATAEARSAADGRRG